MPLLSWIKTATVLPVAILFFSACAGGARELPQDYSSVNTKKRLSLGDFEPASAQLTCREISKELEELEQALAPHNAQIQSKRNQNQVATYIGATFFLPALLATDNDAETKTKIENINKAKDEMYKLQAYKKCSAQATNDNSAL